jgi:hypothetical protein
MPWAMVFRLTKGGRVANRAGADETEAAIAARDVIVLFDMLLFKNQQT